MGVSSSCVDKYRKISVFFSQRSWIKKNLKLPVRSRTPDTVFATRHSRLYACGLELQNIMNSFSSCLTCGNVAVITLAHIRITQEKKIFISVEAMILEISEEYCKRNCDRKKKIFHVINSTYLMLQLPTVTGKRTLWAFHR